jgi:hypothetical protein
MLNNISNIIKYIQNHLEIKKCICIFLFAEILGFLSVFIENEYPFMSQQTMTQVNFFELFFFRFLHLMVVFSITFYIFIFKTNSLQGHIYLFSLLLIGFFWWYFNMCVLNYYELKVYKIDYDEKIAITLPFLKSLFGDYTFVFLVMNAVFPMYTVNHICNKLGYSLGYKMVFYVLFFILSIKYLLISFYHLLDEKSVFKDLVKNFIGV